MLDRKWNSVLSSFACRSPKRRTRLAAHAAMMKAIINMTMAVTMLPATESIASKVSRSESDLPSQISVSRTSCRFSMGLLAYPFNVSIALASFTSKSDSPPVSWVVSLTSTRL